MATMAQVQAALELFPPADNVSSEELQKLGAVVQQGMVSGAEDPAPTPAPNVDKVLHGPKEQEAVQFLAAAYKKGVLHCAPPGVAFALTNTSVRATSNKLAQVVQQLLGHDMVGVRKLLRKLGVASNLGYRPTVDALTKAEELLVADTAAAVTAAKKAQKEWVGTAENQARLSSVTCQRCKRMIMVLPWNSSDGEPLREAHIKMVQKQHDSRDCRPSKSQVPLLLSSAAAAIVQVVSAAMKARKKEGSSTRVKNLTPATMCKRQLHKLMNEEAEAATTRSPTCGISCGMSLYWAREVLKCQLCKGAPLWAVEGIKQMLEGRHVVCDRAQYMTGFRGMMCTHIDNYKLKVDELLKKKQKEESEESESESDEQ